MLLNILIGLYFILVIMDSATTYVGIKHFGLVETWRSYVLFDYYGMTLGIVVSTAFCFCVGWLLWKVRQRFKMATYIGLSILALTELAAVVNNATLILNSN